MLCVLWFEYSDNLRVPVIPFPGRTRTGSSRCTTTLLLASSTLIPTFILVNDKVTCTFQPFTVNQLITQVSSIALTFSLQMNMKLQAGSWGSNSRRSARGWSSSRGSASQGWGSNRCRISLLTSIAALRTEIPSVAYQQVGNAIFSLFGMNFFHLEWS